MYFSEKLKMKRSLCCAISLLLVCVLVQVRGDNNSPDGTQPDPPICARVTHHEDGTMTAVGCGTWRCPEGKHIGYRQSDPSKPYPACCGGPICKDD